GSTLREARKSALGADLRCLIGATGFEPATTCTPQTDFVRFPEIETTYIAARALYPAVPDANGVDQARAPSLGESLTDKRLKALKPASAGQRYTIHDGRTGLAVRVTDKGERSWIVRPKLRTK